MIRAAFRVDASTVIGSGHVRRCLTLALALRTRGAVVRFIMRERAGCLIDEVAAAGFAVERLPADRDSHDAWLGSQLEDEIAQTRAALARIGPLDLLVVDHYAIGEVWERAMRMLATALVVIDDLGDRRHDCDLLLDQNVGEGRAQRYARLVPPHCELLLGPRFALLREQFRAEIARARVREGGVGRMLLFMSGFDRDDATGFALRSLEACGIAIPCRVVLSREAPHARAVAELCRRSMWAEYLGSVENMAAEMAAADLAIGAGGVASLERAAVGLPAMLVCLAENQREGCEGLAASGAAESLGDLGAIEPRVLGERVGALAADPAELARRSRAAFAVSGGAFGTDTVCERIERAIRSRSADNSV